MKKISHFIISPRILLMVAVLFLVCPGVVLASVGAHTYTNSSNGDVFLGGNYIELGISKYGSFGTTSGLAKPTGFYGTAARNNIGMSTNAAGFGVLPDTRIDYFLPGTPEERWVAGYKIGGTAYTGSNSLLVTPTDISDNTVTDQSSGNTLQAQSVGTLNSKLKITQTYYFTVDDKYFRTTVKLENVGATSLDNVRYMRSFDPDNTVDKGGNFDTENKILYTFAAGDGKAVVQADTSNHANDPVHTTNGTWSPILYYTNDSRGIVSYYGFTNKDPYASSARESAPAKGSSASVDGAITVNFDVGTLTPGSSQTVIFYTSLDNRDFTDVIADIEQNKNPDIPTLLGPASYVNGSATSSAQPALEFTLSDPNATNSAKYNLQIADNSSFTGPLLDFTSGLASQGARTFTVGQDAGTGAYTTGSAGQQLSDGNYYWRVKALDDFNAASAYATANSGSVAFIVNTSSPDISAVNSSVGTTTADITWTTTHAASSIVDYGLVPEYGFVTSETDTPAGVTDHAVTIGNLKACARYYYRVRSKNNAGTQSVSDQKTFSTPGCDASAVSGGTESNIPNTSDGTLSLTNNNSLIELLVPAGSASEAASFQINTLDTTALPLPPSGTNLLDGNAFGLIAVGADNIKIDTFNHDLTFTVQYGTSVLSQFDENTIDLYQYSGGVWTALGCSRNTTLHELTCTLPHFSVYAVFGSGSGSSQSGSSTGSSSSAPNCSDPKPVGKPDLFEINATPTTANIHFTPVSNTHKYMISYALYSNAEQYGVMADLGPDGVQSYMVQDLSPNSTYYFKVRAQNGCMPGDWSNILEINTWKNISFYEYLPAPQNQLQSVSALVPVLGTEDTGTIKNTKITPTPTPFPEIKKTVTPAPVQAKKHCFLLWCW